MTIHHKEYILTLNYVLCYSFLISDISVNSGNKDIIEISISHHHYPGRLKLELYCRKNQTDQQRQKVILSHE